MILATSKYNPGFDNNEALIKSFVVRERYLDLILEVLQANAGDANQHLLIIGPRGAGKTMLVRRVTAEINTDETLRDNWYPIIFAEESYRIMSPGEFWLEALFHLADQTQDQRWQSVYEDLHSERDEVRLQQRALAQLMDFADEQDKRLLLIVENLNMLLEEQLSDQDDWDLRHTLLNEPRLMLLGTATDHFDEIKNIDRAWFELFSLYELQRLEIGECRVLWEALTEQKITEIRLKPIQILTGGNPRLIKILAGFATKMSLRELIDNLIQLVDDHTEYFKSKLDNLPSSERKVFVALLELWDPSGARDIAQAARLEVNKASALLNRLVKRGAVMVVDEASRKKSYQVAERLYNIYYLMRRRSHPSNRVRAAVTFMMQFYRDDLVKPTVKILEEARHLEPELRKEHFWAYQNILSSEELTSNIKLQIFQATPEDFYHLPDIPLQLKNLISQLHSRHDKDSQGEIYENKKSIANGRVRDIPENPLELESLEQLFNQKLESYEKAVQVIRENIDLRPKYARCWMLLAALLDWKLERYEEAELAYRKTIDIEPDSESGPVWAVLGHLLHEKLERYEEAESAYRKAIDIEPKNASVWVMLGLLLHEKLERYEEAESAYREAINIKPDRWSWVLLGQVLHEELERYEEAESVYRKAIDFEPDFEWTWVFLGHLFHFRLERYEEAELAYRKAIEIKPNFGESWKQLGQLLHEKLKRYEEAESVYRKAIDIEPKDASVWAKLGQLLHEKLELFEEAELAYRKAIEVKPDFEEGWALLGQLLHERLGCYEEAELAYRKAIEVKPDFGPVWARLGQLLHEKLERYEEAETAYRKTIDLGIPIWPNLICLAARRSQRLEPLLKEVQQYLNQSERNASLLDSLAWSLYETKQDGVLSRAEAWAKQALENAESEEWVYQQTLATILGAQHKWKDALELASPLIEAVLETPEAQQDVTNFIIDAAAAGYAQEAMHLITTSNGADSLEPLVIGLRIFLGEHPSVAQEIFEIGQDVAQRVYERQERLQAT